MRFGAACLTGTLLFAAPVDVVRVVARPVERTSRLPGEILPYLRVSLYARVTGFVGSVEVDRGSSVRKGQLLATLVAPEMTAQLAEAEARAQAIESQRAEAEARILAAQSTAERLKAAAATPGAVAANDITLADKAVEAGRAVVRALDSSARAARASAEALRDLREYLQITAPFDGVVTARNVHPGALVGPGAGSAPVSMLEIEQTRRLRLVVAVPESDTAGIVNGARVSFTVPAWPKETFHGTIERPSRSLDSRTRTMPVEIDVDNARGALAPGMYSEVSWPTRRPGNATLVPPSAVVSTTERTFVIRVRESRAEWVDVQKGAQSGDLVEVIGALQAGDTIVRRGSDEIRPGSSLEVRETPK